MFLGSSGWKDILSITLPVLALAAELIFIGGRVLPGGFPALAAQSVVQSTALTAADTVTLTPHPFEYRPAGAFQQGGDPVDPPLETHTLSSRVIISTNLVSVDDYRRCVAAGSCKPADIRNDAADDLPVTGVSYGDATAYAQWLSAETGQTWRLPTDTEWVFAAGSRAVDDAVGDTGGDNPSSRWLAAYRKSSSIDRSAGATPLPLGSFGVNENGLNDMAGNVWEWTETCYERITLNEDGAPGDSVTNCGVRVVQGAHRTYISHFIRDARGGGCSAGTPPDNLGFRLVREPGLIERLAALPTW